MYDYHSHCNFSDDSNTPMEQMVESAIAKGVKEFAITDHYDPDYPDPKFPFALDFKGCFEAMEQCSRKYKDKIRIVKGIEIGLQPGSTLEKCRKAAVSLPYDFIIGSFHCFCGLDLYTADYEAMNHSHILPDFYTEMYQCLSQYTDYDVVGHFNVIDRYLPKIPEPSDYKTSMDIIKSVLVAIIEAGKGLEINTSSFRYGMGERTTPSREILSLYRDLGGEILTLGSDAHRPDHVAMDLDAATQLALSLGFRYIATYKSRHVTMVKI